MGRQLSCPHRQSDTPEQPTRWAPASRPVRDPQDLGAERGLRRALVAVGLGLAACTAFTQDTGLPVLAPALSVVGLGRGLTFTVTTDLVLSSAPEHQAGAASAVSETTYELGAALGIALLGSIVIGIYRGFTAPTGVPAIPAATPSR